MQSRYYDSEVGRFISPDDITFIAPETIGGLNLYSYCGNNPVNRLDPTGHFAGLIVFGIVGIYTLISTIDGGITAAMNGQDFWKGAGAGAIGGLAGGIITAVGYITGRNKLGVLGRAATTSIYGILNEVFQNGSLDNMNWGQYGADIVMDTAFAMLYWNLGSNVLSATLIGSLIDTGIDIMESVLYNNNFNVPITEGRNVNILTNINNLKGDLRKWRKKNQRKSLL